MDKKEQIISASMKLFIEYGVQGTPMSAIAKAAHTGMGTIYNYFPTKEELINAIFLYIKQQQASLLKTPFADPSVKKRFDYIYEGAIRYFIKHPLHFRFMEQFHGSPILSGDTKEIVMKETEAYVILISEGQKQGIIKQVSYNELVHFVHGGLMGFVGWVINENIPVTKKMVDNQLRIVWDAIKQ